MAQRLFDRILIANRGEIACRIIRTCRRLGIGTVAVHSEADAGALHTQMADSAICIGPPAAKDSYLAKEKLIETARASGAQAIHPGYGFLSENPDFAEMCAAAGIVFIGASPASIRAMGLKDAAKAAADAAGVRVVPGYAGDDQSPERLLAEAEAIGWPVLIKAVAGGGGRGMRRVDTAAAFPRALAGAQREAQAAFGDERVLLEKCLVQPRHIEVQVFGDRHGNCVHLFERDCSIQRRHQKILEEAPAFGLSPEQRAALGESAAAVARAIGYHGAGTVEFIADVSEGVRVDRIYFMEMNTRLQVEHPVTEMVTGLDLVEWQLRVAAGEPLPLRQNQLRLGGHAIEVRLCAEDPARNYLPSPGRIAGWHMPADAAALRVDTGVRAGDEVTPWYDSMLGKLIVHGATREAAIAALSDALAQCRIEGIASNLALLAAVARHPAFVAGEVDTGFLQQHKQALLTPAHQAR
jgi:3-methylcrotonyl-CoA carboxylase alpha subunit